MRRSLVWLGVVACVVVFGLVAVVTHAQEADALKGKIAFTKMEGNDVGKLCVINVDGTGLKEITTSTKMNLYPTWSPDGKRLAYTGFDTLSNVADIFIINADGQDAKRLTDGGSLSVIPSWSPDGKQILFSNGREERLRLRLVNLDGSTAKDFASDKGMVFGFWSPDGKRIGYTRLGQDGPPKGPIYLMNADESKSEALAQTEALDVGGHGAWSPDGKKVAVVRVDMAAQQASLWLFDLESKSETNIGDVLKDSPPQGPIIPTATWSPDGKWLTCAVFEKGKGRIYLFSPDGKTRKPLTPEGESCFGPSWTK